MTDRRTGSVGLNVDLIPAVDRRVGSVGITVDYVPGVEVGVSATQTQSLALSLSILRNVTVSTTQPLAVSLNMVLDTGGVELTVATTQAQTVALVRTVQLHAGLTQTTQVGLLQGLVLSVVVTAQQAQTVTATLVNGYQRVVSAVQATAVAGQRLVRLMRATTGNRRVETRLTLAPAVARSRSVTARTTPRLVRQIQLTRAITQGHAATLAGVPVTLQLLAAVQTRSLALERVITLVRGIVQATAVEIPRTVSLERTLQVPTVLSREQDVALEAMVVQPQAVTLEMLDVTPHYEILVTLTQAQSLTLTSAMGGGTAREFAVRTRTHEFATNGRSGRFATERRGVRFTVEVR